MFQWNVLSRCWLMLLSLMSGVLLWTLWDDVVSVTTWSVPPVPLGSCPYFNLGWSCYGFVTASLIMGFLIRNLVDCLPLISCFVVVYVSLMCGNVIAIYEQYYCVVCYYRLVVCSLWVPTWRLVWGVVGWLVECLISMFGRCTTGNGLQLRSQLFG